MLSLGPTGLPRGGGMGRTRGGPGVAREGETRFRVEPGSKHRVGWWRPTLPRTPREPRSVRPCVHPVSGWRGRAAHHPRSAHKVNESRSSDDTSPERPSRTFRRDPPSGTTACRGAGHADRTALKVGELATAALGASERIARHEKEVPVGALGVRGGPVVAARGTGCTAASRRESSFDRDASRSPACGGVPHQRADGRRTSAPRR